MMNNSSSDGLEIKIFSTATDFDEWLEQNHLRHDGIWIKMAKVNSGVESITSDEAVDVGLCWGWISSHRKALDDIYYLQKYTPRRPRSSWSKVNVDKITVLSKAGRMQPPGQTEVEAAQADGRWEAAN